MGFSAPAIRADAKVLGKRLIRPLSVIALLAVIGRPQMGPPGSVGTLAVAPPPPTAAPPETVPPSHPRLSVPVLDLANAHESGDGLAVPLPKGGSAILTLDPVLQAEVSSILSSARPPQAAVVVMAMDGTVLAASGERRDGQSASDLPFTVWAPAASVFKLVTALALAEHGIPTDATACYHGGEDGLVPANLIDDPRRDKSCVSLAQALAISCNAVVAKLAIHYLHPEDLVDAAVALGFDTPTDLPVPADVSPARIPNAAAGGLALGRTAAGFGDVGMTPLLAATIAETLANDGLRMPPRLVAEVCDASGTCQPAPPERPSLVASPFAASEVADMMRGTTVYGTASRNFRGRGGAALLPFAVAGKTGSLSRQNPYLHFNWFVGFAPEDHPRVAIAVLVGNETPWRVRAAYVAERVLASWAVEQGYHLPAPSAYTLASR
jgi:cell division protein FtsI/penicillin-binding protein 2